MPTIRIITVESDSPAVFEASKSDAEFIPAMLHDPDQVLVLTPKRGGTAYIPVRNITYVHIEDGS